MKRKLEVFHFWAGPEQPPVDALIDRFQGKNPDTEVYRYVLDWHTHMAIMRTRMAEGNPPDVTVTEVGQRLMRFARA